MSKSIEFTESQIKAYENGATCFIFPFSWEYKSNKEYMEKLIKAHSPLQIGDKDVWIKEAFMTIIAGKIHYCTSKMTPTVWNYWNTSDWKKPANEMTKEQSRYLLKEIIDVRVVKVQDILTARELENILGTNFINKGGSIAIEDFDTLIDMLKKEYNQQMQERGLERTYEDNDYVFLITVKR